MTELDAGSFHREAIVVDTHNDLLMSVTARDPSTWSEYFSTDWLPQLRDGGVDVQVLPVFIDDQFQPELALRQTMRMISAARVIAADCADDVALCHNADEIDAARDSGRIALLLALEGCPAIGTNVELFATLQALGIRMASLTHNGRNALADGSGEDATRSRLTKAGISAVGELERLGMLVDVSHLGATGVDHVLEIATRPVIASHSCARSLRDHHRNLSDEHIAGIAGNGGVVCVNFFSGFVDEREWTMDRLINHVEHVLGIAGEDHVGIGPDFVHQVVSELTPHWCEHVVMEGVDALATIPGLEGPRGLPLFTAALLGRGVSETVVRKVLGENVMRLIRSAVC